MSFVIAFGFFALMSCSSDDNKGKSQDCFDCTIMGNKAKICYEEGNDYYTVTYGGATEKQPLVQNSWTETKAMALELCD